MAKTKKAKASKKTSAENFTLATATETAGVAANVDYADETLAEDAMNENGLELAAALSGEDSEMQDGLDDGGLEQDVSLFLAEEAEGESFLPEVDAEQESELDAASLLADGVSLSGTELDNFESADIEEIFFVEEERLESVIESILFASDRPVSLASLKLVFKGTNIRTDKIKRALDQLAVEYAGGRRGVSLEEVPGGYQLRTKIDNMEFLRRTLKARQFKLSGPALEVLSILAYKQPIIKAEIDEIRGVESGHLLRALMEKGLAHFEGKSELPGRPMLYATTKKFLEIFGLRNLKELPTLSQIDELLPEGITEEAVVEKPTLSQITDSMGEMIGASYSQGEEELNKIQEQLEEITTSTQFFEEEKKRQALKRDQEKAQNIREALAMGEPVSNRDANWLRRFDEALAAGEVPQVNPGLEITTDIEIKVDREAVLATQADLEGIDNFFAVMNEDTELERAIADFDQENQDADETEDDELPFTAEADDIDEAAGGTHA